MSRCCDDDTALSLLLRRKSSTLMRVLAINTVMFVVVVAAALYSLSSALLFDALDNLGDALSYGPEPVCWWPRAWLRS